MGKRSDPAAVRKYRFAGFTISERRRDDVFIGEYPQTVDAKFRVNVPAGFRTELGQTFVVAKGINCIALYPAAEWEGFLSKITERKKLLFFTSGSRECELDTQGRVVVPPNMREYLNLGKEITVVGAYKHVEIWNREAWKDYISDEAYSSENIGDIMGDGELI